MHGGVDWELEIQAPARRPVGLNAHGRKRRVERADWRLSIYDSQLSIPDPDRHPFPPDKESWQ